MKVDAVFDDLVRAVLKVVKPKASQISGTTFFVSSVMICKPYLGQILYVVLKFFGFCRRHAHY